MNSPSPTEARTSPFVLVALSAVAVMSVSMFLVATSMLVFLGSTSGDEIQLKTTLLAARDQQAASLAQSQPAMQRFDKLMRDLLVLAQTDAGAKQLITKYGIAVQGSRTPSASFRQTDGQAQPDDTPPPDYGLLGSRPTRSP